MILLQTLFLLTLVCRAVAYTGNGVKGVFAHYIVGTTSNMQRAIDDITQAQAMGLDAFALNVQVPDAPWALSTISMLFSAASSTPFKLFFSLDIAARPNSSDFIPLLQQYLAHPAYYRYQNRSLISTFHGGASPSSTPWSQLLTGLRSSTSTNPLFIPNFEDASPFGAAYPPSIYSSFSAVDGTLGWETAWPLAGVAASQNQQVDEINLANAHTAGKLYVLPVSSYQFKHIDGGQNWYRHGGLTLVTGMRRALGLQPDFVELLTWNDAGEGHWFGNIWPEGITDRSAQLIQGFDHGGWQNLLTLFISALKRGATDETQILPPQGKQFAGAFWYRPLMKNTDCGIDAHGLGKPAGWQDAEDVINIAMTLAANVKPGTVTIQVSSGNTVVAKLSGRPGLNVLQVAANYGRQVVQIVSNADGQVLAQGIGSMDITGDIGSLGGLCNFNYQVVEVV